MSLIIIPNNRIRNFNIDHHSVSQNGVNNMLEIDFDMELEIGDYEHIKEISNLIDKMNDSSKYYLKKDVITNIMIVDPSLKEIDIYHNCYMTSYGLDNNDIDTIYVNFRCDYFKISIVLKLFFCIL